MKKLKDIAYNIRQQIDEVLNFTKNTTSSKTPSQRCRVHCSLQKDELAELKYYAKKFGFSYTAFLRKSAFAYMRQEDLRPEKHQKLLCRLTWMAT